MYIMGIKLRNGIGNETIDIDLHTERKKDLYDYVTKLAEECDDEFTMSYEKDAWENMCGKIYGVERSFQYAFHCTNDIIRKRTLVLSLKKDNILEFHPIWHSNILHIIERNKKHLYMMYKKMRKGNIQPLIEASIVDIDNILNCGINNVYFNEMKNIYCSNIEKRMYTFKHNNKWNGRKLYFPAKFPEDNRTINCYSKMITKNKLLIVSIINLEQDFGEIFLNFMLDDILDIIEDYYIYAYTK